MVDEEGFRPNVGIILANDLGQVLWARRIGQDAWQFPQGGIKDRESPEQALFRELREEVGLDADSVEIIACTRGWLRYRLPKRYLKHNESNFVGQKQKWFLLRMLAADHCVGIKELTTVVSCRLNNTPAVTRKSYIHPAVTALAQDGAAQDYLRRTAKLQRAKKYLTPHERGLIAFLDKAPKAKKLLAR